ncbi:MFS transporter [Corynebacterium freiburgense]|uniref:MFS transporter n=1 Tax=Corynebacterium freiburgense TaxID=556548 RepID=UPI0004096476|nr:MFS transporter [Corynebacterium freiburgense]WJZ03094.1 putative transporter [Corynebacterium freiburgense]
MKYSDGTQHSFWRIPGLLSTLIAVAAAFGSWSLLLPVVPLAIISSGGSEVLAGASTGVFMAATVLTQMCTPRALRAFGYTPVMVFAAALLGIPAFGHIFGLAAVPVLMISAIRGIGFGALTVAESALVAELVPQRSLGKASGALGFVIGLAELVCLPGGVYLAEQYGYETVYITAAGIALLAAAMCFGIPRIKASPVQRVQAATKVATWKLASIPALSMGMVAVGFGAISSFLPAAIQQYHPADGALASGIVLAILGGTQMVSRFFAGMIADRFGHSGVTIIPALLVSFFGMGLLVLILQYQWSVWAFLAAATLFGLGFGAVQNDALLMLFARMPRERLSEASALWNMSFDSGTGLGSLLLGVVVAHFAFVGAFAGAAMVIAIAVFATVIDRLVMNAVAKPG